MLYCPLNHTSHWHRAPKISRSYLLLQYSCHFSHASSIFLPFSLKIPKFSALRSIYFPFSWFFSKCSLNLSIYRNTFVCMGAKSIFCLKLLEKMTYIRGLPFFLAQGPQNAGHGSVCKNFSRFARIILVPADLSPYNSPLFSWA